MKFKNKKAQIDQLQSLIVPLIAIGIVLSIGFLIIAEVKTQMIEINRTTNVEIGINATNDVQNALSDIPGWLPIIIITVIGAILIGLVGIFRRS